jgi:phosphatidylglycerophosphate synthase
MMQVMDKIRNAVRAVMRRIAGWLNRITKGRLDPDLVTIVGFVAHVPIALLIAVQYNNVLAAALLIIFGLFDTLDGELARLQKRDSPRGMLLDASTDRMKEVLLYVGIAYALAMSTRPGLAVWAVGALGASLCVSYVKAKGEAAVAATKNVPHDKLNRLFKDGFLTFELRMALLVIGLLLNQLALVAALITIFASYTALQRLVRISRAL